MSKSTGTDRKSILVIGDAVVPTGFSRVLHSLFIPLSKKYNISQLGVNYFGDPHNIPYPVYPAAYRGDIYGLNRIPELVDRLKPDIIFVLNDLWVHAEYMKVLKNYFNKIKIVMYSPIDGSPIDYKWLKEIKDINRFLVYTDFAKNTLDNSLKTWIKKEGIERVKFPTISILPHGINTTLFYPFVDTEDFSGKSSAKKTLYPNRPDFSDSFIVLNANRNQPRKRIDTTIRGFKLFAENKPLNVKLYLHTGIEDMGWNVVTLCERYGIDSRLILSTTNSGVQSVSDQRLNLIYNACDVGLNTSVGEGWGLCNWEHAATRAAQIIPFHSANIELWGDKRGMFMKPSFSLINERVLTEGLFVTPETVAESLELVYQDKQLREELANNAYQHVTKAKFNWKNISKTLDKIFQEVLEDESEVEVQSDGDIVAL